MNAYERKRADYVEINTPKKKRLFRSHRHPPVQLTWKNVTCNLEVTEGWPGFRTTQEKTILDRVTGYANPGTVTAILGPSGAGKSSLLDILSGRKNIGTITGDVLVNSQKRDDRFKSLSAYVTQQDLLMPTLTVYETLLFFVTLKMGGEKNKDVDLDQRVKEMIEELGLEKVRDVRVGDENTRGISGGEKKRLNIGCEMISDPSLLFLDEPTTGLDASNAVQVMRTLKELATTGRTIICTLHQPRSAIFSMVDYVCCLSEGKIIYFGSARDATDYFETEVGRKCESYYNPADFIVDLALEDEKRRASLDSMYALAPVPGQKLVGETSLAILYNHSRLYHHNALKLERLNTIRGASIEFGLDKMFRSQHKRTKGGHYILPEAPRFAVPWPKQCWCLAQRQAKNLWRSSMATFAIILRAIFMALFIGTLYHGSLKGTKSDANLRIQNTQGAIFFCLGNLAWGQMPALLHFVGERDLFLKEKAAGLYHISAYYIAKTLCDVPTLFLAPCIFSLIAYSLSGFRPDIIHFLTFLAIVLSFVLCISSFFVFFGCLFATPQVAQIVSALVAVAFLLCGGFYIGGGSIPVYYIWLQSISPWKYAYSALLMNEFKGRCFCDFELGFCPKPCQGDRVIFCDLDPNQCLLGKEALNIWTCVIILLVMAVIYRIMGYVCLRLFFHQHR